MKRKRKRVPGKNNSSWKHGEKLLLGNEKEIHVFVIISSGERGKLFEDRKENKVWMWGDFISLLRTLDIFPKDNSLPLGYFNCGGDMIISPHLKGNFWL